MTDVAGLAVGGEDIGSDQAGAMRRVMFASIIGSMIEWYDFTIYGTAATLVFNRVFFPTLTPLLGTLVAV